MSLIALGLGGNALVTIGLSESGRLAPSIICMVDRAGHAAIVDMASTAALRDVAFAVATISDSGSGCE